MFFCCSSSPISEDGVENSDPPTKAHFKEDLVKVVSVDVPEEDEPGIRNLPSSPATAGRKRQPSDSSAENKLHHFMPQEFHDLKERLEKSGIDTSLYGNREQKSLEELYYDTCIVRDCEIVTLDDGTLQRIIAVVKIRLLAIDINKKPRCLYSMGKVLGTGRKSHTVESQDFMSRKIRYGESMQDTVKAALVERLGISEKLVQKHVRLAYDSERQREEKAPSPGYPGLMGLYKFHQIDACIVDANHPDLKPIGLPEAQEFIVKNEAAGDGEFEFLTSQRMWAWLEAPADLTQDLDFQPLRTRKSKPEKTEAVIRPINVTWEVEADGVWTPWAPGVNYSGVQGEEISYIRESVRYSATFHSTRSGTETNAITRTSRKLRVMPQIINLDEPISALQHLVDDQTLDDHEMDLASTRSNLSTASTIQLNDSTQNDLPGGAILGSWKCVATAGLEAFLKASGANMFQRKIALSARWPSWEFKTTSATSASCSLRFINHSAVGDLKEDMLLNGDEYPNKDGHGNPLICSTVWEPTETGGILKTTRTLKKSEGKSEKQTYFEERRVDKNSLEFVLRSDHGSWGRSFIRVKGH